MNPLNEDSNQISTIICEQISPMEGWRVVMCGWGRLEAGVLWVVWMAGLVEMEVEPPPQSESSMFPPLLHPAPHPFCNLQIWQVILVRSFNSTFNPVGETRTCPSCWWARCKCCVGWPALPTRTAADCAPQRRRWWGGTRIWGSQ